ncbi:MAG TPA: ATP-binding protein [Solirubrobacteraceae bacterium]|nr:ATP-binding protein [Solirubrobacteraceae bacterium]
MARLRSRDLFPSEEPIRPPGRLIGRQSDVQELASQLSNGLHRILAAPRRTGKSTVCKATIAALRRKRLYTVSVSLFKYTNAAALAEALAQETLANRTAIKRLLERTRSLGSGALSGRSLTAVLRVKSELGDAVEIALEPTRLHRDPMQELSLALELPQRIAERDDRHLILLIDELQQLTSGAYGDPEQITQRLRETLHASPRVTCLFAGSVEHLMRDLFSNHRRALYQFGGFHELSPITEDEWLTGLGERFAQDDCTVDVEALEHIIAAGERHPRSTMLIAQQTHHASVEEGTRHIDGTLAERGYRGALADDAGRHADLMDRIRAMSNTAVEVTIRLAHHRSPYTNLEKKAANRALNTLAEASVVIRPNGRGSWALADPLFSAYLRREISAG